MAFLDELRLSLLKEGARNNDLKHQKERIEKELRDSNSTLKVLRAKINAYIGLTKKARILYEESRGLRHIIHYESKDGRTKGQMEL